MPLPIFELACVAVVLLTLFTMARVRGDARALLVDYAALAVAGFVGEESCITLYRFYAYAPGWHARLVDVPVLVPLIWPLVILSAREVVSALGRDRLGARARALAVLSLVSFDASLVEVVAVRAGMWSWAEPGHLGVPVIGILGWGYFAAGASLALDAGGGRAWWRPLAVIVAGAAAAHALILATWWGFFRWTARGPLGASSIVGVVVLSIVALASVVALRRAGLAIPREVAGPRMIAAALFVTLLATTAPGEVAIWVHAAAVAIPYLAATSLTAGTRSPAAPRAATA